MSLISAVATRRLLFQRLGVMAHSRMANGLTSNAWRSIRRLILSSWITAIHQVQILPHQNDKASSFAVKDSLTPAELRALCDSLNPGEQSKLARMLGCSPRTMRRKLGQIRC